MSSLPSNLNHLHVLDAVVQFGSPSSCLDDDKASLLETSSLISPYKRGRSLLQSNHRQQRRTRSLSLASQVSESFSNSSDDADLIPHHTSVVPDMTRSISESRPTDYSECSTTSISSTLAFCDDTSIESIQNQTTKPGNDDSNGRIKSNNASTSDRILILPQACLFIANLNALKTDDELHCSVKTYFEKFGELFSVKVERDNQNRPFAFVQFLRVPDARRALQNAHNTYLDDRPIRIEQAKVNRTLFVKFHTSGMSYNEAMDVLSIYGPVEDFTLLHYRDTGLSKGCGFVKYFSREDAIKAIFSLRKTYKYVVEWATNIDKHDSVIDTNSLFIGKLNQESITTDKLINRFKKYGEMESVHLHNRFPSGPNSRPAFAFIRFKDELSAEIAIEEENGSMFLDRIIKVQQREILEQTSLTSTNNICHQQQDMTNKFVSQPVLPPSMNSFLGNSPTPTPSGPSIYKPYPGGNVMAPPPFHYSPPHHFPPTQHVMANMSSPAMHYPIGVSSEQGIVASPGIQFKPQWVFTQEHGWQWMNMLVKE